MLPGIISSQMMTNSGAGHFFGSDFILETAWDRAYNASALYDPVANKTYITWQMSDRNFSDRKGVRITSYDHSTGGWATPVTVGNFVLADDSHGVPTLVMDADGYIYCFFGSHNNAQKWSISASPRDPSTWVAQTNFSGVNTYAHVELVGTTLYFFARNDAVSTQKPLILRTGTPSVGSVTFSSASTIVDLGADSRFYIGDTHVRGTDIHIIATRANAADTVRRGVYYFIYDTTNGSVRNFSGTTTVLAGSLPVSLSSANSNFRLYDHGANDGDIPSLNFDSLGTPHIIFADGVSPTYNLKHLYYDGSAWTTPVTIASLSDASLPFGYVSTYTVAPSGPDMWAIYPSGGDMKRRVFSGGVWGPQTNIARKSMRDYLHNSWVKNASSDIRIIFSEWSPWSSDADAQPTKLFAFGDSGGRLGGVSTSGADPDWRSTRLLLGFNSRNNATSMIDEGPATFSVASVNGNARIDTTQYRFGVSSLYLDGSGDWVTFPNSASWTMSSGDITAEAYIRLNATGSDQVILSRRPPSGTSTEWQFLVTSANRLQLVAWGSAGAVVLNITGTTALASGAWYHVAFSRSLTTTRIFLDGSLEGSGVESAPIGSNSQTLTIGRDPTTTPRYFNGWIDELRVTGSARYTSAFTPPSAPFVRGF